MSYKDVVVEEVVKKRVTKQYCDECSKELNLPFNEDRVNLTIQEVGVGLDGGVGAYTFIVDYCMPCYRKKGIKRP